MSYGLRIFGLWIFLAARLAAGHAASDPNIPPAEPLEGIDCVAVRLAIVDLSKTFGDQYPDGPKLLTELDGFEKRLEKLQKTSDENASTVFAEKFEEFKRKALLANPLLDFEKLLLIKRKPDGDPRRWNAPNKGLGEFIGLPRQSSWALPRIENPLIWENQICTLSGLNPDGKLEVIFEPETKRLVSDVDLHFDGGRLMFSMPDGKTIWQVFEIDIDGSELKQLTSSAEGDVHNYDSCYLPTGEIAFVSTASFQAVPCNSSIFVGMLYKMEADGSGIRQLCFEQDHNYHPTVMNDGRILYLRWEYTDIPHVWARFLFTMNPDGTGQRQYYGSGSYWPNSIFYARPIPNHPTKIAGIVTGHHVGRVGELLIFDPAKGRTSIDGVVQRIPGRGKTVAALIEDKLTMESWPKFLHPYPLSENYFLVSAKPAKSDLWGIYMVDVFDNITLIKEVEGYGLFEPVPIRKVKAPPVIVDRVDLSRKDATVYIEDIYQGPGLAGVPKGAVKELRLFTYHYAYTKFAGINYRVGIDGPWEPKCVLGTVPVEDDGSVMFNIPANTPISIQPLDADGKALQLMRSWMTAMPGEFVSCTGCHEKQNQAPPSRMTKAQRKVPAEIKPFADGLRGFSFKHDVQPVLDKYCVSCHDGSKEKSGGDMPNFKSDQGKLFAIKNKDPRIIEIEGVAKAELMKKYAGVFQPSYIELRKYVRVGGFESDIRVLNPGEFHTNTSELFQILKKGHYGVQIDDEAMKMLATWVDLNTPCHGTWQDTCTLKGAMQNIGRRATYRKMYAGLENDPESYFGMAVTTVEPAKIKPFVRDKVKELECAGWPLDAQDAAKRQLEGSGGKVTQQIDLGNGAQLDMVFVPDGKFVMGDADGEIDESPLSIVTIEKPFWMAKFEITNAQYAQFDASHESRYEHKGSWQFSEGHLGWPLDNPQQPVVRISFDEAMEFCKWLSEKTGHRVTLPTEAQWEYACRAGSATAFSYGDIDTDFSAYANMSDVTMEQLAYDTDGKYTGDITPRDKRFNDGMLVTANVGTYKPNKWGLCDMHGNVWEWTKSSYAAYPYKDGDGRNGLTDVSEEKIVRGGSWRDRPKRCRSAYRLSYPQWQKVYNTGFRVIIETDKTQPVAASQN